MSGLPRFRAAIELDGVELDVEIFDGAGPAWEWLLDRRGEADELLTNRTKKTPTWWRLRAVHRHAIQLGRYGAVHAVGQITGPPPSGIGADDSVGYLVRQIEDGPS